MGDDDERGHDGAPTEPVDAPVESAPDATAPEQPAPEQPATTAAVSEGDAAPEMVPAERVTTSPTGESIPVGAGKIPAVAAGEGPSASVPEPTGAVPDRDVPAGASTLATTPTSDPPVAGDPVPADPSPTSTPTGDAPSIDVGAEPSETSAADTPDEADAPSETVADEPEPEPEAAAVEDAGTPEPDAPAETEAVAPDEPETETVADEPGSETGADGSETDATAEDETAESEPDPPAEDETAADEPGSETAETDAVAEDETAADEPAAPVEAADAATEPDAPEPEPEPVDEARQGLLDGLAEHLGDGLLATHVVPGRDVWARVTREAWVRTGEVCRDELGLRYFSFLSAMDWMPSPYGRSEDGGLAGPGEPVVEATADPSAFETGVTGGDTRFQLLARLQDVGAPTLGLTLKCDVPADDLTVATWTGVFPGADWHERECAEMFGIDFVGHPNLVKLYLPGEFEGYPLRKDFPLLARDVKPWPGLVDVEAMPGEEEPEAGSETTDDDAEPATVGAEEAS